MEKYYYSLIIPFLFIAGLHAQVKDSISKTTLDSTLVKNLFSAQFGLQTGLILNLETRISTAWTLRFEIATDYSSLYRNHLIGYSASIQPRYFYNFKKRVTANKDVMRNAANFFYGKWLAQPGKVLYSKSPKPHPFSTHIILGWGMRRNINKALHYELGIAAGIKYEDYSMHQSTNEKLSSGYKRAEELMIRIGYTFPKRK